MGGHPRRLTTGLAIVALASVAVAAPLAQGAKKKAKAKPFETTKVANAAVPEDPGAGVSTPLRSTIAVGNKFKGKVVGDVNVTGIRITGSAAGAANDLVAWLSAPSGRTLILWRGFGDQLIGPWTLDDDTSTGVCNSTLATPCANPLQSLYQPFAGTSNLVFNDNPSFIPLQTMDGVKMNGTWTLTLVDTGAAGAGNGTSVLNQWGLKITPAKPVSG